MPLSLFLSNESNQSQSISLSEGHATNRESSSSRRRGSLVCELGGMREGEVLFFVPSSIGSCWFVARCLVGLSCLVCLVCESFIFISWVCKLEFEIISLSFCERWETILLIVMFASSSRSAPRNKARLMACSPSLEAWRSTIIEVSCLSLIATTIECKYSRAMMAARSCPSSAGKVTNQASSTIRMALRSITIMIASSSLIA